MQRKHFPLRQRSVPSHQRTQLHSRPPRMYIYHGRTRALLALAGIVGLALVIGCQSGAKKRAESETGGYDFASRDCKGQAIRDEREARSLRERAAQQRELADKSREKIKEYKAKLKELDKSTPAGRADTQFYEGLIAQMEKAIETAEKLADHFDEGASRREALAKEYRSKADALISGRVPY